MLHEVSKKPSEVAVSLRESVYNRSWTAANPFAAELTVADTNAIIDCLRGQGHIVHTSGTKKASATKMAYSAFKNGPKHEKMLDDLFDPLLLIRHLVSYATQATRPSTDVVTVSISGAQ